MGFSVRYISYSVIVLFWLGMTAALVYRQCGPAHDQPVAPVVTTFPEEFFEEQWMGVYYRNEKVGYCRRNFNRTGEGYRISEVMALQIRLMGSPKELRTTTDVSLDTRLKLTSFTLVIAGDAEMKVYGKVEGKTLHIELETAGNKSEQVMELKDDPLLSLSMAPEMLREGIQRGKRFRMAIVDPTTLSQGEMDVEVVGKEKIKSMGGVREAYRIDGRLRGAEFSFWFTEKGQVLREESPAGLVLVKETKEEVLRRGSPREDFTRQTAVPSPVKVPENTRYMKLNISGIEPAELEMEGGRQRLRGNILEIKKEDLLRVPAAKAVKEYERFLKDTPFIQSKTPEIVSLAGGIVKGEKDPLKAASLICDWVYRNIRKEPAVTVPTAMEVLKTRRGDCNEHAVLFAALARAAGLPTRVALGLTHWDGYFYYHAWPEIWIGRWVAVDPTLGQFPADASHIRLITGDVDRQAAILAVIGKIKIDVIECR